MPAVTRFDGLIRHSGTNAVPPVYGCQLESLSTGFERYTCTRLQDMARAKIANRMVGVAAQLKDLAVLRKENQLTHPSSSTNAAPTTLAIRGVSLSRVKQKLGR